MTFEILNVEHGFCAYAVGSDGGVLLFDCGHSDMNRPSAYLPARGITSIRRFFVTNYDEDHIGDLIALRQKLYIEVLSRNPSLNSVQIRSLKAPPVSQAMNELLNMVDSFTGGVNPGAIGTHRPAGVDVLQQLPNLHRHEQPKPPYVSCGRERVVRTRRRP